MSLELSGKIWIDKNNKHFLGSGRIKLLENIERFGSISKAAKEMNISYKTAWDYINEMNNLSDEPLIITSIGGKLGGGAKLTDKGKELVIFFRNMEKHLYEFLEKNNNIANNNFINFVKRLGLQTSARNQFIGKVISIKRGMINCEIEICLKGDNILKATITKESLKNLKIKEDDEIISIIKASSIMIMKKNDNFLISSDNIIPGIINKIFEDSINAEISILTRCGNTITSIISKKSLQEMNLKKNDEVYALFNASSVILGVLS